MKYYFLFFFALIILSCSKDVGKIKGQIDDDFMYQLCVDTNGYSLYQQGNFLQPAGGSPHGVFKLYFNPTAAAALDSTGELPVNAIFPNGSALIKEAFDGVNGTRTLFAVMYKHQNSWKWGEYRTGGSVAFSVFNNSISCTNCHNINPHRDQVRTFDLH